MNVDVFNGDADGILSRHQFRLVHPIAFDQVTLITGVKRDIALLDRIAAELVVPGEQITVFDISLDRNAKAIRNLLDAGARITYFDHHRARLKWSHPQLALHLDESPTVCTSLLVNKFCGGAHCCWAIAAAFGDNLSAIGQQMCATASLSTTQASQLKMLGECLNYNAYGESVDDLHFPPAHLAARIYPYADPFKFIEEEDVVSRLNSGRDNDMSHALAVEAMHASTTVAIYRLPDQAWARRISGFFANQLIHAYPARAHAVLTESANGYATVSIRAPINSPRDAERVARRFANGGGRAIAAGITSFSIDQLPLLIKALEETYQ